VLLVFRGGISPIDRQYSSIIPRRNPQRVNIGAAASSIKKHLIDANPEFSFSSIGFTWDFAQRHHIRRTFGLESISSKQNILYYPIIVSVAVLNLFRVAKSRDWERIRSSGGIKGTLSQDFSGISHAISLVKATRMAQKWIQDGNREISKVIFLRPDVLLLKDIRLVDYSDEAIYCNNYMGNQGDFRWIVHPRFLSKFSYLFSALLRGQVVHEPHKWIAKYFEQENLPYMGDSLLAGVDEEVLRKVRSSGIPFEKVEFTGLSFSEFSRYPG